MSNEVMENEEKEKLLRLAEEKKYRQLKEALLEINEVDIASFMEELDSEKTVIVFRMLPKALATDVFAELPAESQSHIINSITDKELFRDRGGPVCGRRGGYAGGASGNGGAPRSEEYDAGYEKAHQPVLKLSGEQRRKHHDGRVCGPEKEHDRRAVLCLYPSSRRGLGDHLYLLCDG